MKKEQLEAIKARCEAATPGPWEVSPCGDKPYQMWDISDNSAEIAANYFHESNANFVAHAREDVPALIAEMERLLAVLSECAYRMFSCYDQLEYCMIADKSEKLQKLHARICEIVGQDEIEKMRIALGKE